MDDNMPPVHGGTWWVLQVCVTKGLWNPIGVPRAPNPIVLETLKGGGELPLAEFESV